MILPMQKVALVVRDRAQNESLEKLREIGVIHLEKRDPSSDALTKALEEKSKAENALSLIEPYKAPKWKKASGINSGKELIEVIVGLGRERKALQDREIFLGREKARIEAWGEFKPAAVKELAASWTNIFLYELTHEAFAALPEDTKFFKLGASKTVVRLVVLEKEIPGQAVFALPEKSVSEINKEIKEIKAKLGEIEEKLQGYVLSRMELKKELAQIQRGVDFETAKAAMEQVEGVPQGMGFSYITGFVPKEDLGRLKRASAEQGWALLADEPGPDDMVPTKLKNSGFVNLLTPLTGFLEIVPGYHEVDISGVFLFFFTIFFGMIFGDAAYGIMLFLVAIFAMMATAKKGVPQFFKFLLLMSISTMVWGVMTCSWFGVDIDLVPQILQDISFPLFSEAKTDPNKVSQNLQIFCFSLAIIHLSIARLIGIGRNIKSLKVFAELGALTMLWGMYVIVLWLVVSNPAIVNGVFPFVPMLEEYADIIFRVALYLLGGGFVLTFIFANYEGSIGQSVLSSFKNFITVVLGITNVFSDIMSYIRLWAVGLAGASIAATINTMAGPMLGSFLIFAGIILLVAGHGLNLVLNVLSVLVHGVRLNILEFSGHVGLDWSGTAYRPFSETKR